MPTVLPYDSPALSVKVLLKQPQLISRKLTELVYTRIVADRVFAQGSPEQVAGGAARYQRSESIFPDRNTVEVAARSEFPRASWDEAVLTEAVRQYGLEIPFNDLSIRRNEMDTMARGLTKLANSIVKFVDAKMVATLLNSSIITQAVAASASWGTPSTDIFGDIAAAKKVIDDADEGYIADTLIVGGGQFLGMQNNTGLRAGMPRENIDFNPMITGRPWPFLGLSQVFVTPSLGAGTAILMASKVVGTIADEAPTEGGYTQSSPPGPRVGMPVSVKWYRDESTSDWILRGVRWPAIWVAEPKAAVRITGTTV